MRGSRSDVCTRTPCPLHRPDACCAQVLGWVVEVGHELEDHFPVFQKARWNGTQLAVLSDASLARAGVGLMDLSAQQLRVFVVPVMNYG